MTELPEIDGIAWRPVTPADIPGLATHMERVHRAERLSFLPGASFFEWLLGQPGIDPEADLRVAVHDGEIVADAGTWLHHGDRGARCIVWGEASPGFGHLKPALFAWARHRAIERLGSCDPELPRVIRTSAEMHRTEHIAVVEAAGLATRRTFAEMARPLIDLPLAPELPEGITVTAWSTEWEESARLASNEAFADHWGSLPQTPAEFAGLVREAPSFRPDLSFLAIEDGRVVAFCLCEVDEEDNAERDTDDLYLLRVGTLRSHRGRRLATHLMLRAMEAGRNVGLDRAALEVDEMSHTNATVVYERLGFEIYDRSLNLVEELGPRS